MAEDNYYQLIKQMKLREFGLLSDEATDSGQDAHLLCYVWFVIFSKQNLEEIWKPVELGCSKIDLFNVINNYISTNNFDW